MSGNPTLLKIEPSGARLPPNQQLVAADKWPIIGERVPAAGLQPLLKVHGEVAQPMNLTLEQLADLPQTTFQLDLHCVTRWSKFDLVFSGVLLADLLELVQPKNKARYISFVAHSERRHSTSLLLADALSLQTLIATKVGGQPLPVEHGGPMRNMVPNRYLYKSVKWLCELELLTEDRLGYWEAESGYHNTADPWLEQRYLAPSLDRRAAARLLESRDFSGHDLLSIDASRRELNGLQAVAALLRNATFATANCEAPFFPEPISPMRISREPTCGKPTSAAPIWREPFFPVPICGAPTLLAAPCLAPRFLTLLLRRVRKRVQQGRGASWPDWIEPQLFRQTVCRR